MNINLEWATFLISVVAVAFFAAILILGIIWMYKKSKIIWLNYTSLAIIFCLPFERIPSLDIAGLTFRFSQFFTLISVFIFIILFLKGQLKNFKWNPINYWLLGLLLVTIPSIFFVENWSRWFITTFATLIVFAATFIIANFLQSRIVAVVGLILSLTLVGLFGYFQFFGDLIGLPTNITFLKETYTKKVFGFPRVQGTAAEPLYFAGMLFLPIYLFLILYLKNISKQTSQLASKFSEIKSRFKDFKTLSIVESVFKKYLWFGKIYTLLEFAISKIYSLFFGKIASNIFLSLIIFFSVLFAITIAKSAWLALFLTLPVLLIYTFKIFNWKKILAQIIIFLSILTPILYFSYLSFKPVKYSADKVIENFSETILGVSSTSTERESFQSVATSLLPYSGLVGIGNGQYGIQSERVLRSLKTDSNQFFIVNNVYLEIWLELGIVFLIIFILMWIWVLFSGFKTINNSFKLTSKPTLNSSLNKYKLNLGIQQIMHLAILLSIISYLIQWQTFSPIYIMPIFILLGVAVNFNQSKPISSSENLVIENKPL